MMFGLFGKKKEKQPPVILDLSVKEKPDGWDELIRLGFEPVFVNHRPRPNGISGDYVQTRWRLKANPDVTCTVYDSWEGGGGATFLDFEPHGIRGGFTADTISAGPITRSTGSTPSERCCSRVTGANSRSRIPAIST